VIVNKKTLWIILISSTLALMATQLIAPIINIIRDEINLSPLYAGILLTIPGIFIVIFHPKIGIYIDKIDAKKDILRTIHGSV